VFPIASAELFLLVFDNLLF